MNDEIIRVPEALNLLISFELILATFNIVFGGLQIKFVVDGFMQRYGVAIRDGEVNKSVVFGIKRNLDKGIGH